MPEVSRGINTGGQRGGKQQQKHVLDLTEEQKENAALCTGTKDGHICKNPIFRCTECGNFGCDQEYAEKCTDQGFKNDKCLHCGAVGSREIVLIQDLEKCRQEWDKDFVPKLDE